MKRMWLIAAVFLFSANTAAADQCENECPSGQKRAGFADGDHATCQCFDEAPMVANADQPAEQAVTNPTASDGEPTSESAPDQTVVDNSDPDATE